MVHALCTRVLGAADILDGYTRARARATDPPPEDRLFTAFDPHPPFRPPRTRPSE